MTVESAFISKSWSKRSTAYSSLLWNALTNAFCSIISPLKRAYISSNQSRTSRNTQSFRWWHLLATLVLLTITAEVFVFCNLYDLLSEEPFGIKIVKRQYPQRTYTSLNTNIDSQLEKGTRVYHVTKEFGPATLTDIGRTVTALAAAQQATNITEVAIVMPLYTFMKKLAIEKEMDMVIDIRGKRSQPTMSLEFKIWKLLYAFNPPVQAPSKYEWQIINNVNTSVLITPQRAPKPTDAIPVYMIEHANRRPFNQAFKCRTVNDIYTENELLPNEWRDQYFAKAAAAFLAHKATAADEESLFAPVRIVPRVDIVHIHGPDNAYIAKILQDKKEIDDLGPRPPAIVYTIHHNEKEIQYTNTYRNVRKFTDLPYERERLRKYVYGSNVYMTKLGIEQSDAITYTSHSIAADIVEGRYDFHLKELIMDYLLKKTESSRLYGIDNGVDYHGTEHPFITDKLANRSMGYPQYAFKMIQNQKLYYSTNPSKPFTLNPPDMPTYWTLSEEHSDFVQTHKDRARRFLIKRGILSEQDMKRPIVLFRGSFERGKGLEIFEPAVKYFIKNNMRFVILGRKKDFNFEKLQSLQRLYPNHVTLLSTAKEERQFSIFCRAAADFVFTPDPQASAYGFEAAEGLVFGSAVITPGMSKLKEAMIDRPSRQSRQVSIAYLDPAAASEKGAVITSYEYYNSYIYNANEPNTLEIAIRDAATDFRKIIKNKALREEFILRMIRSALNLGWDRGHQQGPVYEYNRVYELALENRYIPEMQRYEVEEEYELITRLQEKDYL
ncbi:starch synthase catalytic domain-containing protein [Mycotypha africana]|uniref:starch synthase catalytic domain-containing protein n=1 Tax=Mycotypha africana TaxID=64632 RepID=UPI002300CE48|nr:starch synthase catalytic domain-containing protein [Mycotypha africana]KAI8971936.1 starch synthase catalytic domain-containing protein [Mycotypha africana]